MLSHEEQTVVLDSSELLCMQDDESMKLVICGNFPEAMMRGLRLFLMTRGYVVQMTQSTAEMLQHCRERSCFLVCVNVSCYDTSWVQLITSMALDPLVYQAPLLVVCRPQDKFFFQKQQRMFSYDLLTYPPSMRSMIEILDKCEQIRSKEAITYRTQKEENLSMRVCCVDDSPATLASLKYGYILCVI